MKDFFVILLVIAAVAFCIAMFRGSKPAEAEPQPDSPDPAETPPNYGGHFEMRAGSGSSDPINQDICDPITAEPLSDSAELAINHPEMGIVKVKVNRTTARRYKLDGPVPFSRGLRIRAYSRNAYCHIKLSGGGWDLMDLYTFYSMIFEGYPYFDLGFPGCDGFFLSEGETYYWCNLDSDDFAPLPDTPILTDPEMIVDPADILRTEPVDPGAFQADAFFAEREPVQEPVQAYVPPPEPEPVVPMPVFTSAPEPEPVVARHHEPEPEPARYERAYAPDPEPVRVETVHFRDPDPTPSWSSPSEPSSTSISFGSDDD